MNNQTAKRVPTPRVDKCISPYDAEGRYRSAWRRLELLTVESRELETELSQLKQAADGMLRELDFIVKHRGKGLPYDDPRIERAINEYLAAYGKAGDQASSTSNSPTASRESQG